MVYGEMGRFPMNIVIKLRMVMFWNSLIDTRVVKQILSGSSI
jgi:hypothetical protein